jgi:hypothetical protein
MKLSLILAALVAMEVFLFILLFSPMFHDSRQKAELVHQLSIHPAYDEARSELTVIHAGEAKVELFVRVFILVCIVVGGWGIIAVIRRKRA